MVIDPEATVNQPIAADPEATFTRPEAEGRRRSRGDRPALRPGCDRPPRRVRSGRHGARAGQKKQQKRNPFAPKSPPETIQANLAALGGINSLVAMANPILAAVPQIRRTLKHPDAAGPARQPQGPDRVAGNSAMSGEIDDETVSAAVYALCALLDESAGATPWDASGGTTAAEGTARRKRRRRGLLHAAGQIRH
jgi:hypothetical protein